MVSCVGSWKPKKVKENQEETKIKAYAIAVTDEYLQFGASLVDDQHGMWDEDTKKKNSSTLFFLLLFFSCSWIISKYLLHNTGDSIADSKIKLGLESELKWFDNIVWYDIFEFIINF